MTLPRVVPAALLAGALASSLLLFTAPAQRAGEPLPPLAPAPWTGWLTLLAAALLLAGMVWPVAHRRVRLALAALGGIVLAAVLALVAVAPSAGQPYAVLYAAVALGFTVVGLASTAPWKRQTGHATE